MMTDRKHPGRPAGLGLAGARLWRRVAAEFEMNPAELMLLEQACRTADVLTGIDEALDGEPLTVKGSMGQLREHPLISEARAQRALLGRLLAALKVPDSDDVAAARAASRSAHGRMAASARWSP